MEEISWEKIQQIRNIVEEDKKRITKTTEMNKNNKIAFDGSLASLQMDLYIEGYILDYPHGRIVKYGQRKYFFRGENKIYDKCYSSLGRIIASDRSKKELEKFKSFLRITKLEDEIIKLNQVWDWLDRMMGDVLFYAIAQHYGLPTNIIDITDDLDVALFFACCIYDRNINRYRPLNKEDIEKNPNGVLYIRDENYLLPLEPDVLPIGYQPFTRCYKQRGYFIKDTLEEDFDLEEKGFKKYFFKHDISFSQEIFDKFHGGEDIFDYKNYEIIDNLVKKIEALKIFSSKVFDIAYNDYVDDNGKLEKKEILKKLILEGFCVVTVEPQILTLEEINYLNRSWDLEKVIEEEGIYLCYRRTAESL